MKLTKQRKIGLVILALSLVAVMVDRVFLLPESAAAKQTSSSSSIQTTQTVVTLDAGAGIDSNSVTPNEELAERLKALWTGRDFDPAMTKDAFSLPALWGVDPNAPSDKQNTAPKPDPAAQFSEVHKLNAVVMKSQGSQVMIDTRYLSIGDTLDGFKLMKIDENSASFEAEGQVIVLKLRKDRYLQLKTQNKGEESEFRGGSRD